MGWGIALKPFERESFFKSLTLYFVSNALLIGFLLYHTYDEEVDKLKHQLFLEMKNYNFDLKGGKFTSQYVEATDTRRIVELQEDTQELYAFFRLRGTPGMLHKVALEREKFEAETAEIFNKYLLYGGVLMLVVLMMAFGFARYTLRPLRNAVELLDRVTKDVIHDLNTPVTAILVNTAMLPKKEKAVQRIEKSAKMIGMLYRNLQQMSPLPSLHAESLDVTALLGSRIDDFRGLYPALTFHSELCPVTITADPDAMERIIDNLLSNACRYNIKNGEVWVTLLREQLRIENSAYGLRHIDRLFERYYKESERGIGLGLHIVKTLCEAQGMSIDAAQTADRRVVLTLKFGGADDAHRRIRV